MLTPQEVSTHVFAKARMGGYNMAMVDEFLDTLTEDYTTLFKENAALKAKLKVLAEKIEEYRATEDSMRATLLTAQKMAGKMVEDAEKEKDALLAQTEEEARVRKAALAGEIAAEQERLRLAKEESAAFIANMRRLCDSEIEFLAGVPELQIDMTAPAAELQAEAQAQLIAASVEASCAGDEADGSGESTAAAELPEEEETDAYEEGAELEPVAEQGAPEEAVAQREERKHDSPAEPEEDLSATRRIDFGDLQFGRNYKRKK